jgi:arylsulfatase A-like enzyme
MFSLPSIRFPKLAVFLLAVVILGVSVVTLKSKKATRRTGKPNIIFILTDDLGYGDLGCYGQQLIKSPNLDRMAAEGMRFNSFYSGSPVCAPARGSLMTGKHLGHAFIRAMSVPDLPLRAEDVSVAEVLKKAEYTTGVIGKWGLGQAGTTGGPAEKGFDYSFCFLDHAEGTYYPTYLWRNEKTVQLGHGTYQQDAFTDDAISFIKKNRYNAFFLYLAYMIPHGPYEIPSDQPYHDEPWPEDKRNYAAMITRMDGDVGRIFALLKELSLDEDTIVFFSSDNGPPDPDFFHSAGQLTGGKRTLAEGGIRVPLIVRWPGRITPGGVEEEPWGFWDFLPTAAEIAGASCPSNLDGISMLPALMGNAAPAHPPLYWEFNIKNWKGLIQAVREERWKGVLDPREGHMELYDLKNDPGEKTDVAAQHPDIVGELGRKMTEDHSECEMCSSTSGEHEGH